MRIFNFLLFESRIEGDGAVLTTEDRFNSLLGCADQLALHVIADQVAVAATLGVFVLESADGVTWVPRLASAKLSLTAGVVAQAVVRDAGTAPGLGLVAVRLFLLGDGAKLRVRIWATGRDHGARRSRALLSK